MFDFGWAELLLIAAIALFVIGPKDIPAIAYQIGKVFRRLRYMQYALTGQFDDFMQKAEAKMEPDAGQNKQETGKEELDHDPHGEADDDLEYIRMMPVPEREQAGQTTANGKSDAGSTGKEDENHESVS